MKALLGLFSLMRLTFSLRAESKVNKVLKEKKAIKATKAFRVFKELRVIKETKVTKATRLLGMKFQRLRVKNSKVRKAIKVILAILVFIMVQLSQKLIKRSLFGLIRQ